MDNLHLYHELEALLRNDSKYCMDDGTLIKAKIVEDALNLQPDLLKYILSHAELKANFFSEVSETLVFDKVKFQQFVINKSFLPDSYTAYKNKIGLTDQEGRFISESREVVLAWPYKDCMLEGGQTKEDTKRNEVFWSESLAPDEITRLTEPKALTGFQLYDKKGAHKVKHLSPTDNLLIKGNNLLALFSLKERFPGKVKMIYIDPPYYFAKNKAGDPFCYNSNFKLSTWLVFMRDRLRVANELLSKDGVLLCHIKEDGVHWLKVLMEEVFGTDNFVETFIWKNTDNPDSLSKKSRSSVEYIICFEKRKDASREYVGKETENGDAPLLNSGNSVHELSFPPKTIRFNIPDGTYSAGKPDRVELVTDVKVVNHLNKNKVVLKGEFKWGQQMLDDEIASGTYFLVKSNKFSIRFQRPQGTTMAPEKFFDEQYLSKAIGVGTNEDASTHLKNMGINFSFSKPESVVAYFVRAVTKEDDWVMDFFVGSGTTAAVAMKMKRRFIAVDQMDYIGTETLKRLRKVIEGEQGGISTSVGWQGGGSFVYCELAKSNALFMDEINAAKKDDALKDIWKRMQETGNINYKINPADIAESAEDFNALSLADKKRFLVECLDKNLLYIPVSEVDSEEYSIDAEDKRLTQEFYNKI
ncbi:MAG: site-specific DNA-methyltransferase [Bacteroidales bacterium]|nr:site-specific DNA-methyltransferase [Bacteroidales bacterium]